MQINRRNIAIIQQYPYESGAAFDFGVALDVRTAWENG
jgi:hypothetical protein